MYTKTGTEKRAYLLAQHYKYRPQVKTLEEAEKLNKKYGNWVCLVNDPTIPNFEQFYTVVSFSQKWVAPQHIYGIWNELILIKKLN